MNIGLRFAILAFLLRAWCSAGGVVCLDTLPLSWIGGDVSVCDTDTADGCCPADDPEPMDPSPACCFDVVPDYWFPVFEIRVPSPAAATPLKLVAPPVPAHLAHLEAEGNAAALRAPPTRLVGVVILQV